MAEYNLRVGNGDLGRAKEYLEKVVTSVHCYEATIAKANELLKAVKQKMKALADARMAEVGSTMAPQ